MSLKNWAKVALAPTLLLAAFLVQYCNGNNPPPNSSPYPGRLDPIAGQWTAFGGGTGAAFIGRLSNPFNMPTPNVSVNYVYTAPPNDVSGKVIRLIYNIAGNATFGTVDGGTPQLRLFLWQQNDQGGPTFRWWCAVPALLVTGDNQELTCVADPWTWTDVNGQNDPVGFNAALTHPYAVGFTFGGQFAGHGVWVTSGSATFKINSFTIQ